MKKVVVAFDIDGTLRCNCTPTCQDVNLLQSLGLNFFRHMKNTNIMIWSGGGADYARTFTMRAVDRGDIPASYVRGVHFASKIDQSTWKWGKPDIAIDDQQAFDMATINLIVREK